LAPDSCHTKKASRDRYDFFFSRKPSRNPV
jgi:hypothetical protein